MISRRPRRAATAAALALPFAAAAALAVAAPAAAAASANQVVIDSVSSPAREPGLLSLQVEATSPITSLTVHIDSTPELTLPLNLTSGSAQDGIWTVATPITTSDISLGSYQVTVDATDLAGDNFTGLSAPDPFFFGLYPTVTIGANTTTLSYTQQSVTFSGQVTAYSPQGLPEDVADQQVLISDSDGGSWSATTDQNGNYSLAVTPNLADGGTGLAASFVASVSSSSTNTQASSPDFQATGDVDPVKITVTLSKSIADYGSPVTLSGTAWYQSEGVWVPLGSSPINVTGTDYYSGGRVPPISPAPTTDGSGDFSVALPAQPTTTWTADPAPSQYLTSSDSQLGLPNSATLTVVLPTATTRLHVAYNPAGQITASGCLGLGSTVSSFEDLTPPADAGLYLQYSRTSSGPWRTLAPLNGASVPSCRGGTGFSGTAKSPALSGHYRVDFTGQLLYQPSISPAQHAATVPTRFGSFSITPHAVSGHGRIRMTGQLQQKAPAWKALGGARITIYVKPAGSDTWYYTTRIHVSSSGRFRISFADPVSGHWVVGYAGDASHLQCNSRIIYVSASGTAGSLNRALDTHALSGRAVRSLLAGG